jgi:hypothetical protein
MEGDLDLASTKVHNPDEAQSCARRMRLRVTHSTKYTLNALNVALEVLGAVAATATILLAVTELARRWPRHNQTVVQPIRRWDPATFEQALRYLDTYATMARAIRGQAASDAAHSLSLDVLYDWGIALILAGASHIDRFSQGKTTLFVMSERGPEGFTILPKYFDGIFPLDQLLNTDQFDFRDDGRRIDLRKTPPNYRKWPLINFEGQRPADPFIASRVMSMRSVEMARVPRPDDVERDLGTTHVLGIPLWRDPREVDTDTPLVITVDFRFPAFRQAPLARLAHGERRSIRHIEHRGRMLKTKAHDFFVSFGDTPVDPVAGAGRA